ncbi:MAG: hypothetical protein ACREIC_15600, partial [Limisphaerales bacterium]
SMSISARQDLAMILPLPVPPGAGEKAVEFIDLKGYREFFMDLRRGFPYEVATASAGHSRSDAVSAAAPKLEVVPVGDFEASFVPTVQDFSRLDERFRLPAETWEKLPQYQAYGFAVFKPKSGAMSVHPMAFSFPRREPGEIFFPTVHIHDGKVHARARFDHALYCQPHDNNYPNFGGQWEESMTPAQGFMDLVKTKGLIEPDQHCYKRELHGQLANRDTVLRLG